tara:strand:+ start:684 stop:797 length:114 start_codon:yes stop_codon:yes gene_type:complete
MVYVLIAPPATIQIREMELGVRPVLNALLEITVLEME